MTSLRKIPPKNVLRLPKLMVISEQLERLNNVFQNIVLCNNRMTKFHKYGFKNHKHILGISRAVYKVAQANRRVFANNEQDLLEVIAGNDRFTPLFVGNQTVLELLRTGTYAPMDAFIYEELENYVGLMSPTSWTKELRSWEKSLVQLEKLVRNIDNDSEQIIGWKRDYVREIAKIELQATSILKVIHPDPGNVNPGTYTQYLENVD